MTICYYHVKYEFQSESTLYSQGLGTKWLWVRIPLLSLASKIPTVFKRFPGVKKCIIGSKWVKKNKVQTLTLIPGDS